MLIANEIASDPASRGFCARRWHSCIPHRAHDHRRAASYEISEQSQKAGDPGELQAWAGNILSPFRTKAGPSDVVAVTNLHPAFLGLDKWPPHGAVYADSQARFDTAEAVAYIKVTYGSAAGHFGLLIGPTNLPTPASREHEIRYTTWAPGVWFFDGQ